MNVQSKNLHIGKNVSIHPSAFIKANKVIIEDNVIIKENVHIQCYGTIIIGKTSLIFENVKIHCKNISIGRNTFIANNSIIAGSGTMNPNSYCRIGERVAMGENVYLDCGSGITIGNDTGIANETSIYTHGAWQNILYGYPKSRESVSIGENNYIGAKSLLIPGVSIKDNCVIGAGSTVTRNIPSGSFYLNRGNNEVLKENYYPKTISEDEHFNIFITIFQDYKEWLQNFNIEGTLYIEEDSILLHLESGMKFIYKYKITASSPNSIQIGYAEDLFEIINECIIFNLNDYQIYPKTSLHSPLLEDFRNFLRREGVRFFTDNHFVPLKEKEGVSIDT